MMHPYPRSRRRSKSLSPAIVSTDAPPIVRLWLLRMLVALNAQQQIISKTAVFQESLLALIGMAEWEEVAAGEFSPVSFRSELRERHRDAESMMRDAQVPAQLAANVIRLAGLVGLSSVDCRILEFAVLLTSERVLDDTADLLGSLTSLKVYQALSVVLGIPVAEVRQSLDGQGILANSGLLSVDRTNVGTMRSKFNLLSDRFADHISSCDGHPIDLLRETVQLSGPGHLTLSDFEHLTPSLDLLQPYLRKAVETHRPGVNVLFHGSPGTGKNQLAKALAVQMACPLYEVSSEDADGDPVSGSRRLRAYRAAQSVLGRSHAMILFDEVQDVFDTPEREQLQAVVKGRKAWLNRALEKNPVPALWLTNSITQIDAAFLRRFDMIIELPVPPRPQRERIARTSCESLANEKTIRRLADCEALAPAVMTRAASVVQFVQSELTSTSTDKALVRLVDQTLRAQGHAGLSPGDASALPDTYDPALIHTDTDLASVAQGLKHSGSARLCLYGPPGTGKTAWARWLATQVDKPLLVRRASDLMSMWLGGSEKSIAAAFRQAEADGAVLLIDEVDSFLQDRRNAQRGWEVSLVNEMLTQMETFDGLFIASTNLMNDLDPAALRRFDLKVRFDTLRPAQALALLNRHLDVMALPLADAALAARVARLDQLTPGDFAAVSRQHMFRPFTDPANFVGALESEVAIKQQGAPRLIGFM